MGQQVHRILPHTPPASAGRASYSQDAAGGHIRTSLLRGGSQCPVTLSLSLKVSSQHSESRNQRFAEQPIDLKDGPKLSLHLSARQSTCRFLSGIRTRSQGSPCLTLRSTLSEQPAEKGSEAVCLPGAKNNHKERGGRWAGRREPTDSQAQFTVNQQTPRGTRKAERRGRVTPHRKGGRRGRKKAL